MSIEVWAPDGVPEVRAGDDLAGLLLDVLGGGSHLADGDVVCVTSKVVSKAEGRTRPGGREEAIDEESVRLVARRGATRIVRHRLGLTMAAAGVDASNTGGRDAVLLLPADPDAEAEHLRVALLSATGLQRIGVVVSDTAGRPWRFGQTDFALGAAGVAVVDDLRGGVDADGQPLSVTARAVGDELAAAADLVKGKADAIPAALVRGTDRALATRGPGARALLRTGREDWFDYGRAEAIRAALGLEPGSSGAEQIGIASVMPEPQAVRVERAWAVAAANLPFGSGADTSVAGTVELSADTAYQLGLLVARLQVALWGEGITASLDGPEVVGPAGDARARITLSDR
jgi:coenzyme F420-0:L-glutamate ligase/coenzyme F420-1:gamma-L-glutamate ligase